MTMPPAFGAPPAIVRIDVRPAFRRATVLGAIVPIFDTAI